jgi:KaiC/GvpD/RAD55 family RecA-like ATPase
MSRGKAMRATRTTVLMSKDERKALDAFAASRGESVGNVVREATARYISQPTAEEEAELAALVEQVNEAIPKMNASIDSMQATLRETHREVDRMLRQMGARA